MATVLLCLGWTGLKGKMGWLVMDRVRLEIILAGRWLVGRGWTEIAVSLTAFSAEQVDGLEVLEVEVVADPSTVVPVSARP